MEKKNRYLLYSIFYASLLLVAIGIYTYGYNPPTCNPPGCNLPAPINTGPDSQTKAGNLTIQGNLTTGGLTMSAGAGANKVLTTDASGVATWQAAGGGWDGVLPNYTTAQRNALSLADGLIVFNTTDNAVQIYKSGAWANVGAKLSLGVLCSLDGDCDSTHCVDGVCCLTTCAICQACNLAGTAGTCTSVAAGTSGYGCTATHYRCDGAGACTAPCGAPTSPKISGCTAAACAAAGYNCGPYTCRSIQNWGVSCGSPSCAYSYCWSYIY